jgi:serine/threonine-protein kinase HipA
MPDRKYQSDGGPGPLDIIETLRAHAAGVADVERFVHSLIFNWVIAGTDSHAKNYGLLLSGSSARLTPLYDLASATVLEDWNPHKWELAMRINGKSRFKYLTTADWRKFANAAGVDASDVIATAIRYADSIGDALLDSGNELSSDVTERQAITRLIDSVTAHAQSIRRTLGSG